MKTTTTNNNYDNDNVLKIYSQDKGIEFGIENMPCY